MNKLIKWLMQNKKRHYKVVYIATGVMGNEYKAGTFEFDVSDKEVKNGGFDCPAQHGFSKYYKVISRHFPLVGNHHKFKALLTTISKG